MRRSSHGLTLLFGAAIALSLSACSRHRAPATEALPKMGAIPAFAMDDQHQNHVTDQTLRGQVLVVDFFFASCTTSCPHLTARMLEVEHAIAARGGESVPVKLVSITLDPENDTPDALARYAKNNGADDRRWLFLTGRSEELDRVVVRGFKMAFEKVPQEAGVATIMHGEWIVLADKDGAIRGYYSSNDTDRMTALVDDALTLAALPSSAPAKAPAPQVSAESAPAATGATHRAKGTLAKFGKDQSYVNIAHEDIPGYMKAMTMSFVPKRKEDFAGFQEGDRVEFEFVETDDARRLLTSLNHAR